MASRRFPRPGLWAGVALLLASAPAPAYEGDHYAWTYYLALQVGYSPRQAYQIASGTYAVDWDSDTGPMPHGTLDEARTLLGAARADIRAIWSKYHAFVERSGEAGDFEAGEAAKARRKEILRGLAARERNPGPYLHYLQDYHAHYGWDDEIGHAPAGHLPDFPSWQPERARQMTDETLDALSWFMSSVLGRRPKSPDREPIYKVLDAMFSANPAPMSDEQYRSLFPPAVLGDGWFFTGLGNIVAAVGDPAAYQDLLNKAPNLEASVGVVRLAVSRDQKQKRLPVFPEKWFSDELPDTWIPFRFDADGRCVLLCEGYAVETPELSVGTPAVEYRPAAETRGAFWVQIRLPYRLTGMAEYLPFVDPLPVLERSGLDGSELDTRQRQRIGGDYAVEAGFTVPAAALAAGELVWTATIHPYGLEPKATRVPLRYSGSAPEREEVSPLLPGVPAQLPGGVESAPAASDGWAAAFEGDWQCPQRGTITFQANGDSVTGAVTGRPGEHWGAGQRAGGSITGTVGSQGLQLVMDSGDGTVSRLTATLATDGRSFSGSWEWFRGAARLGAGTWSCQRPAHYQPTAAAGRADGLGGATYEVVPPAAPGPTRLSFGGRVIEALYERQVDSRGVPIDLYFYRTPVPPGASAPSGEEEWSRFVRVPAANSTSTEPVVWWHARWEYGPKGWVSTGDQGIAPPQAVR